MVFFFRFQSSFFDFRSVMLNMLRFYFECIPFQNRTSPGKIQGDCESGSSALFSYLRCLQEKLPSARHFCQGNAPTRQRESSLIHTSLASYSIFMKVCLHQGLASVLSFQIFCDQPCTCSFRGPSDLGGLRSETH